MPVPLECRSDLWVFMDRSVQQLFYNDMSWVYKKIESTHLVLMLCVANVRYLCLLSTEAQFQFCKHRHHGLGQ